MAGSELLKVARPPAAALPELAALLGQDSPILVDGVAQRQVLAKQELLPRTGSVAKTIVVNIVLLFS